MTIKYDERRSVSRALLKIDTVCRNPRDILIDIVHAVGLDTDCTFMNLINRLSDLITPEWCAEEIAAHEYRVAANILDWETGDTPRVMALRDRATEYEKMARERIAVGEYPKTGEDCDRDALLALADEMDKFARDGGDGFEPVLSRAGCVEYARRIREACGVES